MRTRCELSADWVVDEDPATGAARARSKIAELEIEIDPLRPRAAPGTGRDAAIRGATPPVAIRIGRTSSGQTRDGWPYELVEATVVEDGRLVEARLVVLLDFLQRVSALRIRARSEATLAEHRAALVSIIESARPDWRGEAVALSELWAPRPAPPDERSDPIAWSERTGIEVVSPETSRQAVVRPADLDELVETLRFVRGHRLPHTVRGRRAPADRTVIDLSGLDRLVRDDPPRQQITVEAGCTWRAIVEHLRPQGRRPVVLVDDLDATVGGTLAAGGFGDASHLEGPCIDHVPELLVVRPDGERVRVGRDDELARFTLGGGGRLGVIAEATLGTVARPLALSAWTLTWGTLADFVRASQVIERERLYEVVCARLVRAPDGAIGVTADVGRSPGSIADDDAALALVAPARASPKQGIDTVAALDARARRSPALTLELAVPRSRAVDVVPELLRGFVDADVMRWMPEGPDVTVVSRAARSPLSLVPPGEGGALVLGFRLEPVPEAVPAARRTLHATIEHALAAGGRVNVADVELATPGLLDRQLGTDVAERFRELKRHLDPAGLLGP